RAAERAGQRREPPARRAAAEKPPLEAGGAVSGLGPGARPQQPIVTLDRNEPADGEHGRPREPELPPVRRVHAGARRKGGGGRRQRRDAAERVRDAGQRGGTGGEPTTDDKERGAAAGAAAREHAPDA